MKQLVVKEAYLFFQRVISKRILKKEIWERYGSGKQRPGYLADVENSVVENDLMLAKERKGVQHFGFDMVEPSRRKPMTKIVTWQCPQRLCYHKTTTTKQSCRVQKLEHKSVQRD